MLPSLSILVPARNEAGNIASLWKALPTLIAHLPSIPVELIIIEGNSADETWHTIQQHLSDSPAGLEVRALKQPGRGKADAVRHGLQHARHDLIIILDADLTVDPSYVPAFYQAYTQNQGTVIIGNRLHFKSEPGAMRPLNRLGNQAFAYLLSKALRTPIHDSLCGTKLFTKSDWITWQSWQKEHLRDADPFGDFELLLPAVHFGAKIYNLPVRYKARIYGATNIHRFRDGLRLLYLTWLAYRHVRRPPHTS